MFAQCERVKKLTRIRLESVFFIGAKGACSYLFYFSCFVSLLFFYLHFIFSVLQVELFQQLIDCLNIVRNFAVHAENIKVSFSFFQVFIILWDFSIIICRRNHIFHWMPYYFIFDRLRHRHRYFVF